MRVIRHESGWDVALDMVFTDKTTAETIAKRIRSSVHALVRDTVDASMCVRKVLNEERGKVLAKTSAPLASTRMLSLSTLILTFRTSASSTTDRVQPSLVAHWLAPFDPGVQIDPAAT